RRAASSAVTALSPRSHSLLVNRSCVTSGWIIDRPTSSTVERFLHDRGGLVDHRANFTRELVGQQVGDPDESAASRLVGEDLHRRVVVRDRKSTRLNSSHDQISYAVFCLKKKKKK